MATLDHIDDRLRDMLANWPDVGAGRHAHQYRVALAMLRRGWSPDQVARMMHRTYAAWGWPDRAREIERDVSSAARYARVECNYSETVAYDVLTQARIVWPDPDAALQASAQTIDAWLDPAREACASQEALDRIYADTDLVCWARTELDAAVDEYRDIRGRTDHMQYVVANPMRAKTGTTKDGRADRPRTQANACDPMRRRWVIVEFDRATLDEQARYHCALHEEFGRLRLVVHSGGKSLHGWYDVAGADHAIACDVFAYACRLGADRSLWDHAKLVRMPGGVRAPGERQRIIWRD